MLVDAWPHARVEYSDRASGFGEPLRKLDFERCGLVPGGREPGQAE